MWAIHRDKRRLAGLRGFAKTHLCQILGCVNPNPNLEIKFYINHTLKIPLK